MDIEEEEERAPPPLQATSSSSPDEAVADPSNLLQQDDFRAPQDFLKWVVANLGLEIVELKKTLHSLIDILASAAPCKGLCPSMMR